MSIKVSIKSIYGQDKIYPACNKSNTFCKLLGTKTLTDQAIKNIKELGYSIQVITINPITL